MTELDARYGRRPTQGSQRRNAAWAWGGVLVAVLVVAAFAWSWSAAQDPFAGRVFAYEVVSDTQATVTLEVTNNGDLPVRCEAVAKDRSTLPVGTAVVEVAPGAAVTRVPATITTTGRAVTVVVRDCAAITGVP